ncbi:hypothetical protein DYD21_14400 [Rhodohalobacter sp. SW132]|uniref:relaxase/mobilization nuclease domain-containing protein n=1 Tax=Rhodohalobacter sp. SW132 TaxID=2293433 RepID=UPI000E266DA0|nr:relaxase/mobilization nuclease domain-containing protein [Rhodohalobacter sp. SW132]REL33002.1 hypothetical protein DYD21_14400 [Rhodohalobacter sp. SW132]
MVAKISHGKDFRELINYITQPEKEQWREGRHLSDLKREAVIQDMEFIAGQSQRVQAPAYHVSVSWGKTDAPSKEQMLEVADRIIKELKLENNQALIVAHKDTDHKHMHIAFNRVEMDHFKAVDRWGDRNRLRSLLKEIEIEKGWEQTPLEADGPTQLSINERKLTVRVNEALAGIGIDDPNYKTVRERALELRNELSRQTDWKSFDDTLAGKGLWAEKKGAGMVITDGAMRIKASSLGRSFGKGGLEKRFGQSFDEYVQRRELKIELKPALQEVTGWMRAKERIHLENTQVGMERRLAKLKQELWKIDRFDELLKKSKESVEKGFEQTFSDPKDAQRDFSIIVKRDGLEVAHGELMANPEKFGKVKDENELIKLSSDIRTMEKTYEYWRQYLQEQLIINPKAREEKRNKLVEKKLRINQALSVVKGKVQKSMSQTEAGYSMSRGADEVIAVSRMISAIMKNSDLIAKKAVGRGVAAFKNDLAKETEAGQALVQMSDQSVKGAQLVLKIATALQSGGMSMAHSSICHTLCQHRQTVLKKQMEREAQRGDFSR